MIASDTINGVTVVLDRASPDFALTVRSFAGETTTWFDYCEVHDDCVALYHQGGERLAGELELTGGAHELVTALQAIERGELRP